MRLPKLHFIINENYDARMIHVMLLSGRLAERKQRASTMGIDFSFAQRIFQKDWKSVGTLVERTVHKRYESIGNTLRKTKDLYQMSWDEINNAFFGYVQRKTGYQWEYTVYKCVISAFHKGISNWNGNVIARIWSENPYTMRKITAHELIITHIFSIFRRDARLRDTLANRQIWAIAEITAWCLTGLEPRMVKLWPWITKEQQFPLKHNYPQLVPLQKRLKKVYTSTKNFHVFLRKSFAIVRHEGDSVE